MAEIETYSFDAAPEFMEAISPQHGWWDPEPSEWLFRGHGSRRWLLTPSALRSEAWLGYGGDTARGLRETHEEQVAAEFRMLDQFLISINSHGHTLPPNVHSLWFDWARVHDMVHRAASDGDEMWPPVDLYGLLALAQHHGVPTRLLDWSRSSRVSAFFAAERAATWVRDGFPKGGETDRLAVWAFRETGARPLWNGADSKVRSVVVPQDYNANLRAQRGMFTVHTQVRADPHAPPVAKTLDELIRERVKETGGLDRIVLREMTLPVEEAPRLLRLLSYEGITSAAIFPTLDGVVRELGERRLWD